MNILITGAAGDIGTRLVKYFSSQKEVNLFSTDLFRPEVEGDYTHENFDIRQPEIFDWIKKIKPVIVIHLASIVQLPKTMTVNDAHDVDVKATENIMKTCVEAGVEKIIVTSSGAAYGYWPDNAPWLSEEMPIRGNEDYFYSDHKRQVEEIMAAYKKSNSELKQVILRPGTVLGPNFNNPITNMFSKKIITGIMGTDSPFVIIWVDDLVAYLIEAATGSIEGVYNVAGDGTLSLDQIAKRLNKIYLALPSWFIRFALGIAKPLGLSQYGPEQVKFLEFRPVLANKKIKQDFLHQPSKTTKEAFESFLQESYQEYVK